MFKRVLVALSISLILSACAQHVWDKPGGSQQSFTTDRYGCERDSRQSGGFDNGLIGAIEVQGYFNRCMEAHGWSLEDKAVAQASKEAKRASLKEYVDQRKSCFSLVRDDQKYSPLLTHLIDIDTGRYTLAQMSDASMPTVIESKLLLDYVSDNQQCVDTFISEIGSVSPPAKGVLRTSSNNRLAVASLLIRRQISWGDASSRLNAISDETKQNLKGL